MIEAKLVEDAHREMVEHLVERGRTIVEGGRRREDHCSDPGEMKQILQMDRTERRLAGDQDQLAPFLYGDVGRAGNEIIGVAHADRGQRLHAAGHDNHAVSRK